MPDENLTVGAALIDLRYFRELNDHHPADTFSAEDVDAILAVGERLAVAVAAIRKLSASRVGADDYIAQFDAADFDSYSFYQGVSFALAKVNRVIEESA